MRPLLVIGSSGHASVVIEALTFQGEYKIIGLLDSFQSKGTERHGHRILGTSEDFPSVAALHSNLSFFVAVGDNWWRDQISRRIAGEISDAAFATVIHPHASVSK